MKTTIQFKIDRQFVNVSEFPNTEDARKKRVGIFNLYPSLMDIPLAEIPENQNPRSHGEDVMKSHIARKIRKTLLEQPELFHLVNRGSTVIASDFSYDARKSLATITINDPNEGGMVDGSTSAGVIKEIQAMFQENKTEEYNPLERARMRLEVISGFDDKDDLIQLIASRNTSIQVRCWSINDLLGDFDFIKEELKGTIFEGRIGYEENSPNACTILDVLQLLTAFHPKYTKENEAPVAAYASKGKMPFMLKDENMAEGYKALAPVMQDLFYLFDHIQANFHKGYNEAFGEGSKLGRRVGIESGIMAVAPLTGATLNFSYPLSYILPLFSSMRCLLRFRTVDGKLKANWKGGIDPKAFFDKHSKVLIKLLFNFVDELGNNPNKVGKSKVVYVSLFEKAQNLYNDDQEQKSETQKD